MELLSLLLQLTAMVRFLHSPSIAILFLVAFEVLESFKEIKIKSINRFFV